jgi:hypothetical protein
MTYSCKKKVRLFFHSLTGICRIRIRDPDPGSGSGIKDGRIRDTKNGRIWIRDKHPGSATLVSTSVQGYSILASVQVLLDAITKILTQR